MSLTEHEIDISTGRRDGDGHLKVSIFMDDLVAFTVVGHGERAPTLLLTLDQARKVQDALAELIPMVERSQTEARNTGSWRGEERRSQDT